MVEKMSRYENWGSEYVAWRTYNLGHYNRWLKNGPYFGIKEGKEVIVIIRTRWKKNDSIQQDTT